MVGVWIDIITSDNNLHRKEYPALTPRWPLGLAVPPVRAMVPHIRFGAALFAVAKPETTQKSTTNGQISIYIAGPEGHTELERNALHLREAAWMNLRNGTWKKCSKLWRNMCSVIPFTQSSKPPTSQQGIGWERNRGQQSFKEMQERCSWNKHRV